LSSELPARERESHDAFDECGCSVVFTRSGRLKFAVVPHNDFTRAIIPFRKGSLEQKVVERVVVNMDREALHPRVFGWPLRHCPRDENRADLQSEVIVETPSPVLLDHESASRCPGPRCRIGDDWGRHADGLKASGFFLTRPFVLECRFV